MKKRYDVVFLAVNGTDKVDIKNDISRETLTTAARPFIEFCAKTNKIDKKFADNRDGVPSMIFASIDLKVEERPSWKYDEISKIVLDATNKLFDDYSFRNTIDNHDKFIPVIPIDKTIFGVFEEWKGTMFSTYFNLDSSRSDKDFEIRCSCIDIEDKLIESLKKRELESREIGEMLAKL